MVWFGLLDRCCLPLSQIFARITTSTNSFAHKSLPKKKASGSIVAKNYFCVVFQHRLMSGLKGLKNPFSWSGIFYHGALAKVATVLRRDLV